MYYDVGLGVYKIKCKGWLDRTSLCTEILDTACTELMCFSIMSGTNLTIENCYTKWTIKETKGRKGKKLACSARQGTWFKEQQYRRSTQTVIGYNIIINNN